MSTLPRAWEATTAVTMTDENIEVPDGTIPAKLFRPEGGTGAGIVLVQEIFGISNYILQRAADLADKGWTVLVPNLYWRIGGDVLQGDEPDAMPRAMDLLGRNPWDDTVADIRACIASLRADEKVGGRVALLGFCHGGGLAYAASSDVEGDECPDALVSYYGSALPDLVDKIPVVDVPSLHHFGEADEYIPFSTVQHIHEVVTRGKDVEFSSWPGAGHAFDNPLPIFHHAQASEDAWRETYVWLLEHHPDEIDRVPASRTLG
ncbi:MULTISPECIES: dienelactone hydrolase family protein [Luteococcus]|uniref:Dienelactone hydrolase family n=1 Tax=Luteococcus japonicus LSP_Lj1 TaxID=1255658 RepID=A0A1R4JJF8_9ACTN|nr:MULTISPECIES: dienelactone hydrolase family protein [Luteococcus]MDN5562747.1 dienelactone hydrolase family protein [Luteococcus sp.]SJN32166.1 Dienelactone hydrolase family [Luteococcus japonicus LSP_Lj1]